MNEKDDEATAGEREMLQQDVVDERENEHQHHTPEVNGAFPAYTTQDVGTVGPRYYIPDGLSQVAGIAHRFVLRPLFFASALLTRLFISTGALLVLHHEQDDHGNGEEEREQEGHKEDEHRYPADGEQLGAEEEYGEERQDEDAHAHNDAELPRLKTRHVAVVEENAVAATDVGAVEQHEGVLSDVLVRVQEERHDRREHARVQRHYPDTRALLRPHADAAAAAREVDDEDNCEEIENEGALCCSLCHCRHVRHQTRGALHGQQVERQQSLDAVRHYSRHEVLRPVHLPEQLIRLDDDIDL